jgi:rod shape-determining protein MreB
MDILNFLNAVVYVKLSPEKITVREAHSGYEISEPPQVAIARKLKEEVVAFGNEAATIASVRNIDLVNPFQHPRALLSDFTVAEVIMKHFVTKAAKANRGGIFRSAPIVVLHPLIDPEGGFTQIEIRAMHELAIGAGARKVIVWQGRELGKEELLRLKFESGGKVLN